MKTTVKSIYGDVRPAIYDGPPVLSVVIDTEEEFDWSQPHNREQTATSSLRHIGRAQEIFDRYAIKPCYVIDYPVAVNQEDHQELKRAHDEGRCIIGTHLHPWVTPPFTEEVNALNSFPGNLDRDLEYQKLKAVTEAITDSFGHKPLAYKAGRYGVGVNTREILEDLGYQIELSPTPGYDYSAEGGPDFSGYSNEPFWFGKNGDKLCLPCSGGFVGALSKSTNLYRRATSPGLQALRTPGILARLGIIERIRLSPEGFTLAEMQRVTRFLVKQGVRHFTLSFHSPSLAAGFTPYVRNTAELGEFLERISAYIAYFREELGGRFGDPESIINELR